MPGFSVARKLTAAAKLALAVVVAGLLVAAMMLPFVGGMGVVARNSVQSFEEQPCNINPVSPPQRSVLYAADGQTVIATFFSQNRVIAPLAQIPEVARKAVVAIEDRRFYEHHGVDLQGLTRAVVANSRSGGIVQGGSTLTMQYVKLYRQYSAKTAADRAAAVAQTSARKLIDARCALTLEQKLSKNEILERYLNIAYFGAGAYGIGTAARVYFARPLSKVTLEQAALLAGLVQSPSRYDPYRDRKAALARRNTVLDEMQSLGYVTAAQAAKAKATPLSIAPKRPQAQDCANANRSLPNAGFFCDYAKAYLSQLGIPQDKLENGGYSIVSTLNPTVQRRVQAGVSADMPSSRKATSVMDVLDTKTGKVLAMAVSKKYGNNRKDRTQTSLGLGWKAVAGAGSTYKLFTLIAALQRKIPLEAFTIHAGNKYTPTNCGHAESKRGYVVNAGHYPDKPYNLDEATYASVNTFFVALLDQQFDCDLSEPVSVALGIGMNALKRYASSIVAGQQYSFTLGPQSTSPLELASAYATVGNDGKYCPPTPIERITGSDGKGVALPDRPCVQKLDPGLAHTVSQVLVKDTKPGFAGTANSRFAGYYASGGSPVAGKTGTASAGESGLNSSAWFIGYTPEVTASVATFNPTGASSPLEDVPGYENNGGEIFGAFSAGIWRDALGSLLLSKPGWDFPPADPGFVNGNSVPVPSVVGMDLGHATAVLAAAGFGISVSPERKDGQPQDRIAEQSPSGRGIAGQTITVYLGTGSQNGGGGPGIPTPTRRRPGPPGHR